MRPNPRQRPTKLWRGRWKLARKYLPKYSRKILEWAIAIKPGDWIATCEGCNRQVTDIQYGWENIGDCFYPKQRTSKTWILTSVRFTDSRGRWHHCPGGGCALPKQTNEEIETYHRVWISANKIELIWGDEKFLEKLDKMDKAFRSGGTVIDENGQYLPEFE